MRITKDQYLHCTQNGTYADFIRRLIEQDMQGNVLEDKIRAVLLEMGISNAAKPILINVDEKNATQPETAKDANGDLTQQVTSSILNIFQL